MLINTIINTASSYIMPNPQTAKKAFNLWTTDVSTYHRGQTANTFEVGQFPHFQLQLILQTSY